MKYYVMWISLLTGYVRHGRPLMRYQAEAAIEFGNINNPDIHHWINEVMS